MIVSRRAQGLVVVRQVDHQDHCGQMAAAWGNERFARPEPWAPIERAAAWHDEGWRSWEQAPEVDEEGAPVDFPHLDRGRHADLYRAGVAAAARRDPLAAMVVSLHGQGLYQRRMGLDGPVKPLDELSPPERAFAVEQIALRRDLTGRAGAGPVGEGWLWDAYWILQALDALSLYLLWRAFPAGREGSLPKVPRGPRDAGVEVRLRPDGPRAVRCAPFPFAGGELTVRVAARTIPDRRYADHDDLRAALSAAEWQTEEHTLRAG